MQHTLTAPTLQQHRECQGKTGKERVPGEGAMVVWGLKLEEIQAVGERNCRKGGPVGSDRSAGQI